MNPIFWTKNYGFYCMNKKHSYEERLLAVKKCLEGIPIKTVGRELGINHHCVAEWYSRYQLDGSEGLLKRPCKHANFAEKRKIVCEYAKKGVPLHQICAKHHVSQHAVKSWTRIFRQGGYEALRNIIPQGTNHKGMGRPKKKEPVTEIEKLQRENELLRAENAYLKKLRALMIEKESHAIKTKP